MSVNQIYDKAIRSVVWIVNPDGSQGSGVLIDKELKLVVTNEHVVDTHEMVYVFFPAVDMDGMLIHELDFYLKEENQEVLIRLGYLTRGRVVAKKPEADLAILELDGITEAALEIDHDFSDSARLNTNDRVHVLGNPEEKLWRWTGGFFQLIVVEDGKHMFWIDAGTYPGNSGGPVLNERGKLIGIISRSNLRTRTVAVPLEYVDNLLKTLVPRRIVSISNDLSFTIHFQFRVPESDNWEKTTVAPEETAIILFSGPHKTVEIRFDHVVTDDAVSYHYQELQTYQRRAGSGFDPSRKYDAHEYHFDYNRVTERLELQDSEGN